MSVKEKQEKTVETEFDFTLPCGICRWTCCAECPAGDYDSSRDQVWCGKRRHWYDGSDGCSDGPND